MPGRASKSSPFEATPLRRFFSRLPMRLRITVWVLLIFTVVQLGLSLVIFLVERESTELENREQLAEAAQSLATELKSTPGAALSSSVFMSPHLAAFARIAVVDVDQSGSTNIVGRLPGQLSDDLEEALHDGRFDGASEGEVGRVAGFYYASQPYAQGRRLVLVVPVTEAHAPLRMVALTLMILVPAGIVASGISAWYVASLVVRPMRRLEEFAEELGGDTYPQQVKIEARTPELESLREKLDEAMHRIEDRYDAQARFLANVSHELKTPIAVVRTEGEVLLVSKPTYEELTAYASTTVEEMDRLGRMIESFLLLTRVRQGKLAVKSLQHSANDILMEAASQCNVMAKQYDVRLEPILYDGEVEPLIEGNADLLNTALTNLVRNAIRFAPKGSAVRLKCDVRGSRVVFRVRDFGPGIPEEVLEHLFEPFTQSAEERRRGRGTGLGLLIAHGIAELHQGEVRARNLKKGCEFSLRVNRLRADVAHEQSNETGFM